MRIYATSRIYIMYNILSVSTVRDAADGFQFESDEAVYSGNNNNNNNNNNIVLYVYACVYVYDIIVVYICFLSQRF